MKKFLFVLAALLALAAAPALVSTPALAALQVDVTQANPQPLPIAIPDFLAGGPGDGQTGANIAGVVRADLERSGLFTPARSQGLCRSHRQCQHGAQFRQLACPSLPKGW